MLSRTLCLSFVVATLLAQPAFATEWDSGEEDTQKQEAEGVSCMKMCLEEGEDPMDCNYYCIQVVQFGPDPVTVACR